MNKNNTVIILQGYTHNPIHIYDLVQRYNKEGFNKIILSTYMPCVKLIGFLNLNCDVVLNDLDRKNCVKADTKSYRPNKKDKVNVGCNLKCNIF